MSITVPMAAHFGSPVITEPGSTPIPCRAKTLPTSARIAAGISGFSTSLSG